MRAVRPPAPQGATVAGQAAWLPALQQEAARLCASCTTAAGHPGIAVGRDSSPLPGPASGFPGPRLPDLGGLPDGHRRSRVDDLGSPLTSMDLGAARIHVSFLEDELLRVLITIYQPGVIYNPDDFQELATVLAQY